MEPNTLRLPPNTWNELTDEAEMEGFRNRSEYIRHLIENREAITNVIGENTKSNTGDYARNRRVDELEERIEALEARMKDERREPAAESEATRTPPQEPTDHTDAPADLKAWFDGRPPRKSHGKRAVIAAVEHLRENGTASTSDLKDAVMRTSGEHYSGEKAAWESLSRYFKDVPGVEKGGYGEWEWNG